MKKTAIFYHLYQVGNWDSIWKEQFVRMQSCGLYDESNYIFVGINGNLETELTNLGKIGRIHRNTDPSTQGSEFITLKAAYDYCRLQDCNLLYIHSKGVSFTTPEYNNNPISENSNNWRRYLENFVVDKWRECVDLLNHYDCVGTEWVTHGQIANIPIYIPHYSGTMWWATSDYIKTLDPNFLFNNILLGRYAAEFWIGTNHPKAFNYWSSGRNLYYEKLHDHEYVNRGRVI